MGRGPVRRHPLHRRHRTATRSGRLSGDQSHPTRRHSARTGLSRYGWLGPCPTLDNNAYRLADTLLIGECSLCAPVDLKFAEHMVSKFNQKVSLLTALRRKLEEARVQIWPGTTRSDAH